MWNTESAHPYGTGQLKNGRDRSHDKDVKNGEYDYEHGTSVSNKYDEDNKETVKYVSYDENVKTVENENDYGHKENVTQKIKTDN